MCIKAVTRLKLYLPRQKWTINKTLTFFKIRKLLRNFEIEAGITKREINSEWNIIFFFKYNVRLKSVESKVVFTQTETNNERNADILQIKWR